MKRITNFVYNGQIILTYDETIELSEGDKFNFSTVLPTMELKEKFLEGNEFVKVAELDIILNDWYNKKSNYNKDFFITSVINTIKEEFLFPFGETTKTFIKTILLTDRYSL